jgi:4,5-dihydroxyphthalate decarboxylase
LGQRLRIACWDYDRVAALRDGRVGIEGCDIEFSVVSPHNFFFRAGEEPPYEVMEQSLSSYMTRRSRGPVPYTAIPVYPSRMFRHSSITIRTDRGIRTPADLKGRRVGVPLYGITAAMTARGFLADEYGVKPEDIVWVNGALEAGDAYFKQDLGIPKTVRIEQAPDSRTLCALIIAGEIDAIVAPVAPSALGAPNVARLFPDYRTIEQAYFKKTGIFPIMHVLGIKTGLLQADPSLAQRVYRGFCQAKDVCMEAIDGDGGASKVTLPWLKPELDATRAIMGEDFWPYGIEKSGAALEAATRWSFEQHLSPRKLSVEELFAPETVGVPA